MRGVLAFIGIVVAGPVHAAEPAGGQDSALFEQSIRCAAVLTVAADFLQGWKPQAADQIYKASSTSAAFIEYAGQHLPTPQTNTQAAYNLELAMLRGPDYDGSQVKQLNALKPIQGEVPQCLSIGSDIARLLQSGR